MNKREKEFMEDRKLAFSQDGFAELGPLVLPDEMEELSRICALTFRQNFGFDLELLRELPPRPERVPAYSVISPEQFAPALKQTALLKRARQAVNEVWDVSDSRLLCGWRLYVKPRDCMATPWHQDAAYRPPPHQSVTVWCPLEPVRRGNGALRFLPNEAEQGLVPHDYQEPFMVLQPKDERSAVTFELNPGEATLHHCLTQHASWPFDGPGVCRIFSIIFQMG